MLPGPLQEAGLRSALGHLKSSCDFHTSVDMALCWATKELCFCQGTAVQFTGNASSRCKHRGAEHQITKQAGSHLQLLLADFQQWLRCVSFR